MVWTGTDGQGSSQVEVSDRCLQSGSRVQEKAVDNSWQSWVIEISSVKSQKPQAGRRGITAKEGRGNLRVWWGWAIRR